MKIDFENAKTRIAFDIVTLIVLLIFGIGMCLYNIILPCNTTIRCDKSINLCKFTYSSILSNKYSLRKNIEIKISDINEITFVKAHMMSARSYRFANVYLTVKNIHSGFKFYNDIIEPSINEDDTFTVANNLKTYMRDSNNDFYFNRNDINPQTRYMYTLGIVIYIILGLVIIITDICQYKKKLL